MFSRDSWQEIFETIRKNKLRTILSGFTVALGIFIFVILSGFGNGLQNTFKEFFVDDATNVLRIFPGRTSKPYKGFKAKRRIELENSDIEAIKINFPLFLEYITPRISRGASVKYNNKSDNYTTRAIAPSHQASEKTIIMEGRFINEADIKNKTKYAVIGRKVATDLFGKEDPMGKYLDVGKIAFKVIGVFKDAGGDNEESYIYIPYTTRQLIEKANDNVDQIIIAYKPSIGHSGAISLEKKLRLFLKKRKSIDPTDQSGIFIRNVADELKRNEDFAGVLEAIVIFVAIGTLIAGIIGISNIMVFVVKERTKELGIRKALGASPKSVILMILQESVFITLISGYFGLASGMLLLKNIGTALEEDYFIKNPYVDLSTAIISTFILIIFGGVAGYIPAKRAARIKPIIALRDE
ncbi:MAG: ABC transporter ATP-binding protein [Flavobacteriaceae bacterium TMED184]|nr:MAG: ABC transporter ATP-binding protein [Flavobacteriaceae bacterium TMED184]